MRTVTAAQSPYHCNLMLAGYDQTAGPSLYWLDYLATLNKINTGGTGYGEGHNESHRLTFGVC